MRLFYEGIHYSSLTIGKWTPKSQLATMTNHFTSYVNISISEDSFLSPAVARHLFVSTVLTVWRCVIDDTEVNLKLPTWRARALTILLKLMPPRTCAVPSSSLWLSWHFLLETALVEPTHQLLYLGVGRVGDLMEFIWSHLQPLPCSLIGVLSHCSLSLFWTHLVL